MTPEHIRAGETLGAYLKRLRTALKLKLRQVEDRTGVSNSLLSMWENNKVRPTPQLLILLAPVYGVSREALLHAAGMLDASSVPPPSDPLPEITGIILRSTWPGTLKQEALDTIETYARLAERRAEVERDSMVDLVIERANLSLSQGARDALRTMARWVQERHGDAALPFWRDACSELVLPAAFSEGDSQADFEEALLAALQRAIDWPMP